MYRKGIVLALTLIVCVSFVSLIKDYIPAVLLAGIFGVLLHPVYCGMRRKLHSGPGTTSAIIIFAFMLMVGLPVFLLVGLVGAEALSVSKAVTPWIQEHFYSEGAETFQWPDWLPFETEFEVYKTQIINRLEEVTSNVGRVLFASLSNFTRGTIKTFLSLFIFCYALFFFLKRGPELADAVLRYLPLKEGERTLFIDRGLNVTQAILKSILIIGFLQGGLVAVAFWVLGIEGAIFWGAIVMIISAIPVIGSGVVWLPAVIFLLLDGQSGAALGLFIWGVFVVGLIDNILRPRLVGGETNMPDLLILLSIFGGLAAFGVTGIIIGPVFAAVFLTVLEIYKVVFKDWVPQNIEAESD